MSDEQIKESEERERMQARCALATGLERYMTPLKDD